jgi:hypothetical protein
MPCGKTARPATRSEIDLYAGVGCERPAAAALGDPQDRLPPVVHVAGTNGKGSTVRPAARHRLEAAKAGACIPIPRPHLVRFNERIRLAGQLIDDDALIVLSSTDVEASASTGAKREATVFETHHGRRLPGHERDPGGSLAASSRWAWAACMDATNIIERPLLSFRHHNWGWTSIMRSGSARPFWAEWRAKRRAYARKAVRAGDRAVRPSRRWPVIEAAARAVAGAKLLVMGVRIGTPGHL